MKRLIIEAGELDKQEFIKTVKAGLSQVNEVNIMTLAEQFRQEGRQEGYQKGQHDGIEKGKLEGKLEGKFEALKIVIVNLAGQGMTINQISSLTGLSVCDVEKLKNQTAN